VVEEEEEEEEEEDMVEETPEILGSASPQTLGAFPTLACSESRSDPSPALLLLPPPPPLHPLHLHIWPPISLVRSTETMRTTATTMMMMMMMMMMILIVRRNVVRRERGRHPRGFLLAMAMAMEGRNFLRRI
jgi:hypothetical protein